MLWAYLDAAIYDDTGGYTLTFAISAGASLVALVCTLLIKEVRHAAPGANPYDWRANAPRRRNEQTGVVR